MSAHFRPEMQWPHKHILIKFEEHLCLMQEVVEARSCWTRVVSECTHLANKAVQLLLQGSPCSSIRPVLLRFLKAFPVCLKAYLRRPGSRALDEQIQGCAFGIRV
jgi:predicted membrane chloride channel (bestrophin family)